MKVASVDEMRSMDRSAIEDFGIREEVLMENAALATYQVIREQCGVRDHTFVVFCGMGNNGGDGFVVARKLHSNGAAVTVCLLGDERKLQGAARVNYDILTRISMDIRQVESAEAVRAMVERCDAVVDAIFGTGLARDVGGLYREIVNLINASGTLVFCVDIPSGINGDTGAVMGVAVSADYTVTYGLPKRGNLLYPGSARGGELAVTHISFPPALYEAETISVELNEPVPLPPRDPNAHKGDCGEVLFVAGAANYFGAPYFAAMSFLKGGGGYARLAAPRSITPFIAVQGSEIVFVPQEETEAGSIALSNRDALLELAGRMDMAVIGPGLSLAEETQALVRALVHETEIPLLLDGDGITAVAGDLSVIRQRKGPTILTPHLGEMSRIMNLPVPTIDADKITHLKNTAADLKAIIVMKGAHSLIGYPDGHVAINLTGNAGMATAGSGDVLTGAIAAMYGLGQSLEDAVRTGVLVHGLAGDLAAHDKGQDGVTAGDILALLPKAVNLLRKGDDLSAHLQEYPRVVL